MTTLGSNRWSWVECCVGCGFALSLACGGDGAAGSSAADEPEVPAGGSGARPFAECPTPIGTAEELALTPRPNVNLELLALSLDAGHLTATQATYERVVADVGAIRALAPSLASVSFYPPYDGYSLMLDFSDRGIEALAAGTYTAWDCLMETYRGEIVSVSDLVFTHFISLGGIFDLPQIAELFDQLPDAGAEIFPLDGRRELCATRDGEHYDYVVDETDGRCDSSPRCTGRARHFATNAPGELIVLESWTATNGPEAPGWFRDVCQLDAAAR